MFSFLVLKYDFMEAFILRRHNHHLENLSLIASFLSLPLKMKGCAHLGHCANYICHDVVDPLSNK